MEPLDALALATSTFVAVLDQVGDDQLTASTPCEEWDVGALERHVAMGNEMAVALIDGASREEGLSFVDKEYDGDLDALCRATLDDQLARMRAVTDWDAVVHHAIGDVSASQLLGFRIGDLALHAWDLATAIGADSRLPEELASYVYDAMAPMEPFIGSLGIFGEGPSGTVDEGADVQRRLLDLTGRRA
ncbi:MAG: TIGR03086 family metal-binding protein [Acidimicrobiales bacterium]|jgi:uncharacterized protein (TIGR03086 family)